MPSAKTDTNGIGKQTIQLIKCQPSLPNWRTGEKGGKVYRACHALQQVIRRL
ncbi:hypothetical protein CSC30_2893 [Pseudomonas aeruginosa]|uniref:Uncharacterized protein n=1 Tax=Pseudomonas putida TaxID=303 RepID=A0A223Q3M3_PSEPU|nr:Hypothetical protein [Pseudomonas putida]AWF57875.1 hypothetical protein CSC30_5824 [Pseudomonas aeruginosa]AWF61846.1 hypothetical protein CSC30_2893 [Pseudomonas aeruginosa]